MNLIHKIEIPIRNGNLYRAKLPINSHVLSCDFQGEKLVAWFLFNEKNIGNQETRIFYIMRTGEPVGEITLLARFVGTAYDRNEQYPFVIHLFEGEDLTTPQ